MKKYGFILLGFLIFSCTSNTIYKEPTDLIPKDTMVSLISDVVIASSSKTIKNKNLEVNVNYMPFIYNKYKIDSTRFAVSNLYYTSKIELYEELMLEVKNKITKQQQEFETEIQIKDSLETLERDKVKKKELEKFSKNRKFTGDSILEIDKSRLSLPDSLGRKDKLELEVEHR